MYIRTKIQDGNEVFVDEERTCFTTVSEMLQHVTEDCLCPSTTYMVYCKMVAAPPMLKSLLPRNPKMSSKFPKKDKKGQIRISMIY